MPARVSTIALALGLLTACGSSSTPRIGGRQPPVIRNPPDVVSCGFGGIPTHGIQEDWWQQWCERAREMHGPFERYSMEGTLMIRGEFVKNEPHGKWVWFHETGERQLVGNYESGSPSGEWEWRHANGETAQRGGYAGGVRHGHWISYFEDRAVASDGFFKEGSRDGEWTFWNEGGQVMRTQDWKKGTLAKDIPPNPQAELIGR